MRAEPSRARGSPARKHGLANISGRRNILAVRLHATITSLIVTLAALLVARRAAGGDVSYYGIIKSAAYQQSPGSAPTLVTTNAYGFSAFVVASTNFVITNATVKPPSPSPLPAQPLATGTSGMELRFDERFSTQAALDAAYPTATLSSYTFTIGARNDGLRTASANFLLAGEPMTPQVSNLPAAQQIDTTTSFTLTWNPLNGTTLDIVQVLVLDRAGNLVFASPVPFSSNALNGASTSLTIPPNSLPWGTTLTGHLMAAKPGLPNTSSYPGATGIGARARDTEFPLTTRPAPAQPVLRVVSSAAAPFTLAFLGETNRNYHLQASTNLLDWPTLFTTNSPTGTGEFADSASGSYGQRAYRIRVGP